MTYESCFIKYTHFGRESQAFWRNGEIKERMMTHDQPEPQAQQDVTAEKLASSTSSSLGIAFSVRILTELRL